MALVALGLLSLAACAGTSSARRAPRAPGADLVVSAAALFAPGRPTPDLELEELADALSTPAMLRKAFLALQCRRPDAALDAAARVLYGPTRPSGNEEAFARFARSEAYTMMGAPERGRHDLDRARELALDTELQRRIGVPTAVAPGPDAGATLPLANLAMQSRARWQPMAPKKGNLEPMGRPTRLTIHHSAMYFRDTSPATCAAQIQAIQRDHMRNRGYGDIGYHYLVDPSGRVWEGRDLRYQGAHASGDNNVQNIGVCLLGNFMRGRSGQGPTQAQIAAMRTLVAGLMQRYSFGPEGLHCHSDFKATECPGPLLEPHVADLARDLRQGALRMAGSPAGH